MGIVDTGRGGMERGETHFRWVTYRIRMEPNNPTRIGGCEYVCTRLFGMEGRYDNSNNTAMVPLLSKLMTAEGRGWREAALYPRFRVLALYLSISFVVCMYTT